MLALLLYHSLSFLTRQGLSLNLELSDSVRLAGQCGLGIPLSLSPLGFCLFICFVCCCCFHIDAKDQTQVLVLVWKALTDEPST